MVTRIARPVRRWVFFATAVAMLAAWLLDGHDAAQGLAARILLPVEAIHARVIVWLLGAGGLVDVNADGNVVRHAGFSYAIDPGCLGLPLIGVLVLGVLASGATRRRVICGAVAAVALLIGLNVVRLVHLFCAGLADPGRFAFAHEIGWPAAFVIATIAFWSRFRAVLLILALLAVAPNPVLADAPRGAPPSYDEVLSNDEAFQRFLATLPRYEYYYILEGDIRLTESEIRPYLSGLRARSSRLDDSSELLVNLVNAAPDYWADTTRRQLTYAVDRRTFTPDQYARVVGHMSRAARDWEAACPDCGVRFVHRSQHDDAPSHEQVVFIVRQQPLDSSLIALAFFPSQPSRRRFLDLDPRFLTTSYDRDGILRHELGHILGYRHERLAGSNACYVAEEGRWMALTPYDSKSVMHHPCEGVTQEGHTRFVISEGDKQGHRALYGAASRQHATTPGAAGGGPPSSDSPTGLADSVEDADSAGDAGPADIGGVLVVRLEGGEVAANAAHVAGILVNEGFVGLETSTITANDSVCSIYHRPGRLPGACCRATFRLAATLNDTGEDTPISTGQSLKVPKLGFEEYDYVIRLDPSVARDNEQLDRIKKHWSTKVRKVEQEPTGVQYVTLVGYRTEIRVESAERAKPVRARLHKLDNVKTTFRRDVPYEKVLYGNRQTPATHWLACVQGEPPAGDQGDYWRLFPTSGWEIPSCARECGGERCPRVFIADAPIAPHPDITAAMGAVSNGQFPGRCTEIAFNRDHHGTHLAGIVAAQDNSFGFVGVNPGARIESYNWVEGNIDGLAKEIQPTRRTPAYLFLFASQWDLRRALEPDEIEGLHLVREKLREQPEVATRILQMQPLWIAAAGQWDRARVPKGHPLVIRKDIVFGPMNLGDLRNVVIVTACDDCSDATARLLPDANYSNEGLVHVAASGVGLPGLATTDAYARAGGTSQAAALVAGVASAMLGCYPDYYTAAELVKVRLQVTARPVLSRGDAAKLTSGIVDPALALQDPTKSWLDPSHAAAPQHWCRPGVHLVDRVGNRPIDGGYTRAEDIYRIVRYRGRGASDTKKEWVVYAKPGYDNARDRLGEVRRLGPGMLPNGALLRLADGGTVRLEDVEDVVLAAPIGSGTC